MLDQVLPKADAVPLALVCDLLEAEACYQLNSQSLKQVYNRNDKLVMLLAENMLLRGGLHELHIFAACLGAHRSLHPFNAGLVLPAARAAAFATICRQRSKEAACPDSRYLYRNLALFFAAIRNERPVVQGYSAGCYLPGHTLSLY